MRGGTICCCLGMLCGLMTLPTAVGAERADLSATPTGIATFEESPDGTIIADGIVFPSREAYFTSEFFQERGLRCGTVFDADADIEGAVEDGLRGSPSDCSYNNTNPAGEYDPSVVKYLIPVVVHVIQNAGGTGYVSPAMVASQIEVLNEDYLAMLGTPGAPGTDVQVEFYLATEDPNGNPTTGITYSTNTTWYNDGGSYWNTLAWDPNRYLNIYTNSAGGYLGYVPFLPQQGGVGSSADRVVCYWASFGRNSPNPPYHMGRTATHEVGHYLGLFHTFQGGCATGSCYTGGDRICDTNNEQSPRFGCPSNPQSCGNSDPYRNYLDYTDDTCMNNFTREQANRIRCTMEHYRPNLYQIEISTCVALDSRSIKNHAGVGDLPLDMGLSGAIEPRAGGVTKLEIDVDDPTGFTGGITVNCEPTAYAGAATHTGTVGNTVTIEFSPGLPEATNCTVTLDCSAAVCVRNLEGDSNLTGVTDASDNAQRKARFGQAAGAANLTWDVNASGAIDTTDNAQSKLRFGDVAPACP